MSTARVCSWGNTLRAEHALIDLDSRFEPFPALSAAVTLLPFGNGRSYGDCCLNRGGALVRMRCLDRFIRFIRFDRERGILECEAGVLLQDILRLTVPAGWFLPVTPGTRLVTVGGAIANDVHGKNHHQAGTFGCHVRHLTLLANRLESGGRGTIVVVSSVAGDRGRASNYVYGSAKALVTAFCSGLRQRLSGAGVRVITIKPGFVDTPMTRGLRKGLLWVKPEAVARGIVRAMDHGQGIVYLPGFWRPIMLAVRAIPERLFARMRL